MDCAYNMSMSIPEHLRPTPGGSATAPPPSADAGGTAISSGARARAKTAQMPPTQRQKNGERFSLIAFALGLFTVVPCPYIGFIAIPYVRRKAVMYGNPAVLGLVMWWVNVLATVVWVLIALRLAVMPDAMIPAPAIVEPSGQ